MNVGELFAQHDAHLFRRAGEIGIVAHDVIVQRLERDQRVRGRVVRFRVRLRHFVHSFMYRVA